MILEHPTLQYVTKVDIDQWRSEVFRGVAWIVVPARHQIGIILDLDLQNTHTKHNCIETVYTFLAAEHMNISECVQMGQWQMECVGS